MECQGRASGALPLRGQYRTWHHASFMSLLFWQSSRSPCAFAASVQTAVGFGFGLVLVPILLALGRTLPESVALTLGAGLVQTVLGLRS